EDRRRRDAPVVRAGDPPAPSARGRAVARRARRLGPHLSEPAAHLMVDYRAFYRGRAVMITGGLGFIGSNLARQLVDLGADVLLAGSLIPDYGGNLFNIADIADRVRINIADQRMQSTIGMPAGGQEGIFHLACTGHHIDK